MTEKLLTGMLSLKQTNKIIVALADAWAVSDLPILLIIS